MDEWSHVDSNHGPPACEACSSRVPFTKPRRRSMTTRCSRNPRRALALSRLFSDRDPLDQPRRVRGNLARGRTAVCSTLEDGGQRCCASWRAPCPRDLLPRRDDGWLVLLQLRAATTCAPPRQGESCLRLLSYVPVRHSSERQAPAHDPTERRQARLNPLERARTELELAPGFLVRSAPKPRCVVDRVGA